MRETTNRIWNVFNRDKHTRTMGVIILLTMGILLWQEIAYLIPAKVTVEYSRLDGKSQTVTTQTRKATVEEMLKEQDIQLSNDDVVSPCREYPVSNGMEISVAQCIKGTMKIHGKKKSCKLVAGTVKENLALNGVEYDQDDHVSPKLSAQVTSKTKIVVDKVHKEVKEKTESVKAGSKVILDPDLSSGTVQESGGKDGKAVYTYTTTYINGKKQGTQKKLKKWITKAEDATVRCGTASTGESGEVKVKETFTAETTAYYAGTSATGATGQKVHFGTCAVDPSVIPYGTKLYIEGYGIAVANDCGGAVKGHIVDLYMHSNSECIQWGRQNRKAYILAD